MDRSGMSSKQNDSDHDMKSLTHWHELMVERISQRKKVFCDTLKAKMTNDINAYMHNLRSSTTFDTIQQDLINIVKGYDYGVASQTFIDGIICAAFELFCQLVVVNSTEFITKARTAFTFTSVARPTPPPSKSHEEEVKMPGTSSTTVNFSSIPTAGRRQNLNQIISQSVLSNMSALNGGINLGDVSASINRGTACSSRNYVSEKSDSNNDFENSTVLTAPHVSREAVSEANSCQTINSLNSLQSHSLDSVLFIDENINTALPNDISPNINDKIQIKFSKNVSSSNFLDASQVKGEDDSTDSMLNTTVLVTTDNSIMNTGNTILVEATSVTENSIITNDTSTDNNKSIHECVVNVSTSKSEKCDRHNSNKKASKKSKKPIEEKYGILEKGKRSPTKRSFHCDCSNIEIYKKKKSKTEKEKNRSKSKNRKDKSNFDKKKSLEFHNTLNKVLSSVSSSAAIQSDLSNSESLTDNLFSEFMKKSHATKNVHDSVACSENPTTSEITDFEIVHSDSTNKVQTTKYTSKQAELSKERDENVANKNDKKKDTVIAINTKKQYERAKKDLFLPDFVFSSVPKKYTNKGNENTNKGIENISEAIDKPDSDDKSKTKKRRRSFSLLSKKIKKRHHEYKVDETKIADTRESCHPELLINNNNPEIHNGCSNSDEKNIYDCENSNMTLTSENDKNTLYNNNILLNYDLMPEWIKELCDVHKIKNSYVLLS